MKLVFSQIFPPEKGGSGKWLYEAYARMPQRAFVMLVGNSSETQSADSNYPQYVVRANLRMKDRSFLSLRSFWCYLRMIWILANTVRRYKVNEVHAARPLFEGLSAAITSCFIPIQFVQFVHGEDVNIATTSRKLRWATSFTLKRAKLVITNSHFSKNLLLEDWKVPSSKIHVVHPGVDLNYFKPSVSNKSTGQELRILTVGRLQKRKGHDMLIRSMAELTTEFPMLRYRIAGEGEERQALERLAKELGVLDRVDFLGEIDETDLLKEYQSCDLFVLPNRSIGRDIEGFGMVLLEAQACGKPVIAGRSGGTTDALDNGTSGYLALCDSTEELVASISRILSDPEFREQMGEQAVSFVNKRFSWEHSALQLQTALNRGKTV